jgi:5-hydroxyisourate hydrolase
VITTHVLDTARGKPAAGVPIRLERAEAGQWQLVGSGVTDDDGRLRTLTPAGPVAPGAYQISFDTAAYFALQVQGKGGNIDQPAPQAGADFFFPLVQIQFVVADGASHYHVPLLLSPFGYSTYRGS